MPNGSTFEKVGTPLGVDLTEAEAKLLTGADLAHTHTTTIGGTFSWEDIELTVITKSPHHVVTDVLKKKKYELTRTSEATKKALINSLKISAQKKMPFATQQRLKYGKQNTLQLN